VVAGVRFPQKLIVTSTIDSDGKTRVVTITFDRVVVNETFPASTFELPFLSGIR
jgi:outer membrane lipoprotein-sorting protein